MLLILETYSSMKSRHNFGIEPDLLPKEKSDFDKRTKTFINTSYDMCLPCCHTSNYY